MAFKTFTIIIIIAPQKSHRKKKKERKKRKEKERITRAAVADQDEFKRWHFPSCRGHVIM